MDGGVDDLPNERACQASIRAVRSVVQVARRHRASPFAISARGVEPDEAPHRVACIALRAPGLEITLERRDGGVAIAAERVHAAEQEPSVASFGSARKSTRQ